ncbi:MAG TPA: hypothetical protein PKA37_13895, partial [Planctomycetota bacterium]|nr:hypothetical protein [Planctomycetota bacterium]
MGIGSSNPQSLTVVQNKLFFVADNGTQGRELWVTNDGLTASLVADVRAGPLGSQPQWLKSFQGFLYFSADDGINGRELWRSDGTALGTVLVKDIFPGNTSPSTPKSSNPRELTVLGGLLHFVATDDAGSEIWQSDGTAPGTNLLLDVVPGSASSHPQSLTAAGSLLYFTADTPGTGRELWRTDGTVLGTFLIQDTMPGVASSLPSELFAVGSQIYFQGEWPSLGRELLTSDGSGSSVNLIKDIHPSGSSAPRSFSTDGTHTIFFADNGSHGLELWRTDGTESGTVMVKDIHPGAASSLVLPPGIPVFSASCPTAFLANDGVHGVELWITDGSDAGTTLLQDIEVGPLSSLPLHFASAGGILYFAASTGAIGAELRVLNPEPAFSLPTILVEPSGYAGCPGTNVTFAVVAVGCNLTYQWFKDGQPIIGANQSILEFAPAYGLDDGNYTVLVTSGPFSTLSTVAVLAVADTQPPNLTIPTAVTLPCLSSFDPNVTGLATATDACDPAPIVTWSDTSSAGSCAGETIITRTWSALDVSNNLATGQQIITLTDQTPPTLVGTPAPTMSLGCITLLPTPE